MSERVELDRLADYAAGLLDGTPEAAEVGHLIATDTAWAVAYAELMEADRRVRADLIALGAAAEPMPAEVVAQLDATLDAMALDGPERDGRRTVVSLDASRRRRRRWAALATVAAGVAAFGVFGLPALRATLDDRAVFSTSAGDARGSEERAGKPGAPAAPAPATAGLSVSASGLDYRREMLRVTEEKRTADSQSQDYSGRATAESGNASAIGAGLPQELRPLAEPAARDACLAAVTAAYGGRAVSVDYAHFEGVPALIVRLVDANSKPSRIVVAGAACGQSGSDADVRYTVAAG